MGAYQAVATLSTEEPSLVADEGIDKLSAANDNHRNGLSEDLSWLISSDDESDGTSTSVAEWKSEALYEAGYLEGILAGKAEAAQDGYNHGFKDSVMVGYKWGVVRGVTSALAHLPNELKKKLVEKEEVRKEFLSLHGVVDPITISTEDALELFYKDVQRAKSVE